MVITGRKIQFAIALAVVMIAAGGCRKQQTTLAPAPTPAPQAEPVAAAPAAIDTSDNAVFREAQLEAELQRRVNETLVPIYFEFNSYRLSQDGIEKLVKIGSFMGEYATLRVLAEGHCDERGSSDYNMGLGENRARAVRDYLVNYGMGAVRIETTSMGKERPARRGCADDGCHAMNRRVEFRVIGK